MATVEVFPSEIRSAVTDVNFAGQAPQVRSIMYFFGGPCENRTHDQRIKSPLLYLAELTAQIREMLPNRFQFTCQKVFCKPFCYFYSRHTPTIVAKIFRYFSEKISVLSVVVCASLRLIPCFKDILPDKTQLLFVRHVRIVPLLYIRQAITKGTVADHLSVRA